MGPIFSFNISRGTVGNLLLTAAWLSITGDVPVGVDGRVLSGSLVGDCSVWVEVARYGDCSLIVRKNYLNVNDGFYGDAGRQVCSFSSLSDNVYLADDCLVRSNVNAWFNGVAFGEVDSLPLGARLRGFTMRSDAVEVVGSCGVEVSLFDGFSKPSVLAGVGDDVAFVLSFGEAASFMSGSFFDRNVGFRSSSFVTAANYAKFSVPFVGGCGVWLRSPGDLGSVVGCLGSGGRVFQSSTGGSGFVYPAVWVHSSIFEMT
jgi:hypothetical protein